PGERQDAAQDRADARRPADGERDAHRERAEIAGRLRGGVPPPRAPAESHLQEPRDVEPEDDDERAADPADPIAIVEQELPRGAERRPERDEDEREARDDRERVERHPAARG